MNIKTKISVFILFLTAVGCSQQYDNYNIAVKNSYFESLYHADIGGILLADTLPVCSVSRFAAVSKGHFEFSALTASGLRLSAGVSLKGSEQNITLTVNENGRIVK